MEDSSINVKYDAESRQSLEQANFEMKMKIFYLEEEMRKVRRLNGNGHSSDEVDELKGEIESLKLQMQEKGLELDQRKYVL